MIEDNNDDGCCCSDDAYYNKTDVVDGVIPFCASRTALLWSADNVADLFQKF